MKKSYLLVVGIFLLGFYSNVNALTFAIVNSSFNDSVSIQQGSSHWIDIKSSGAYSSSTRMRFFISHHNIDQTISNVIAIFDEQYYSYFDTLQINTDGSRRLHFTMPTAYIGGTFDISDLSLSMAYGIIDAPSIVTNITDPTNKPEEIHYYNELGSEILKPDHGFYIWKTATKSGKSYAILN